jgi:preprotein translocase subunit SecG
MKIRNTDVNKRSIIRWKVYFDRSRMYIGYIQFFLIGVVFLQSFKGHAWGDLIFQYAIISIPVAIVLFIILSLILGYLDSKLGLREEEFRNLSKSNPVMMEILESVKEIQAELKEMKEGREEKEI